MRPRSTRRAAPLAVCGIVALTGCALLRSAPPAAGTQGVAPPISHARLEVRQSPARPATALVHRSGDPHGAVALALAHDGGSAASVGLAALLEARLGRRALSTRPHALGAHVSVLVSGPDDVARFVRDVSVALRTPVTDGDAALERVREKLAVLSKLAPIPDNALERCSGDLSAAAAALPVTATALDEWRQQVTRARGAAFGAVGERALLDAAAAAVAATGEWPEGGPDDPWPEASTAESLGGDPSARHLSVALRLPSGARAVAAARWLGAAGGERLSARLSSLSLPWTADRISATLRPRGACLRVDLSAPPETEADADEVAWAAWVLDTELRSVVEQGAEDWWAVEDGILRASDPREAAAIAAWRALSAQLSAGPARRFVRHTGAKPEPLQSSLGRVEQAARAAALPVRSKSEPGQGELWLLLASPCSTSSESVTDAGVTALTLRALAKRAGAGVTLAPWLTPEGAGLLARGPRLGPTETPDAQARRIADALGRALAVPLDDRDMAPERDSLLGELDAPAQYWTALEALSPNHPSWLEPRGTFRSVSQLASSAVDARRRSLTQEPLRLAVLANGDPTQSEIAARELSSWLAPARRRGQRPCSKASGPRPKRGELVLDAAERDLGRTLLAVPLPSGAGPEPSWVAHALGRPGGLLARTLSDAGLGSARATVLGGRRRAAQLIELVHYPEDQPKAISEVRALLTRLAQRSLGAQDLALTREHFLEQARLRELDPRERVARLWTGGGVEPEPTPSSLAAFCRTALDSAAHLVVAAKN